MVVPLPPTQVAVFCGGLGTRLRPHTELLPKPMVDVAGLPFLEHLLHQMADAGIRRILLMTGYMGDVIHRHFGDGSRWGWDVVYSHGPAGWDTGRRIFEAAHLLDQEFILLYSDNWADVYMDDVVSTHRASGRAITTTLAGRALGNIRYSREDDVTSYDPTRSAEDLTHVEIGYMMVDREETLELLAALPGAPDVGFSAVLRSAAEAGRLGGHPISGSYLSISDAERLAVTRDHFAGRRILLIDRDGTINRQAAPGEYVADWAQFEFVPETVEAMETLAVDGFEFIVITNQAGIALGVVDEAEVRRLHEKMVDWLAHRGIRVVDVYMSPDHWESDSTTRKPAPGMFHAASEDHRFRLDRVLYVGNDVRDCLAAAAAGCGMVYLADAVSVAQLPVNHRHCSGHRFLTDAVEVIRNFYGVETGL